VRGPTPLIKNPKTPSTTLDIARFAARSHVKKKDRSLAGRKNGTTVTLGKKIGLTIGPTLSHPTSSSAKKPGKGSVKESSSSRRPRRKGKAASRKSPIQSRKSNRTQRGGGHTLTGRYKAITMRVFGDGVGHHSFFRVLKSLKRGSGGKKHLSTGRRAFLLLLGMMMVETFPLLLKKFATTLGGGNIRKCLTAAA